jgi:adenosylmethionine-8-amino-7-oxononanoate aminotransferase
LDALEQGVIVRPLPGDVLAMSPPFVVSEEQIDRIVQALDKAIARVATALNR